MGKHGLGALAYSVPETYFSIPKHDDRYIRSSTVNDGAHHGVWNKSIP